MDTCSISAFFIPRVYMIHAQPPAKKGRDKELTIRTCGASDVVRLFAAPCWQPEPPCAVVGPYSLCRTQQQQRSRRPPYQDYRTPLHTAPTSSLPAWLSGRSSAACRTKNSSTRHAMRSTRAPTQEGVLGEGGGTKRDR